MRIKCCLSRSEPQISRSLSPENGSRSQMDRVVREDRYSPENRAEKSRGGTLVDQSRKRRSQDDFIKDEELRSSMKIRITDSSRNEISFFILFVYPKFINAL